jgi:hypothetical protein
VASQSMGRSHRLRRRFEIRRCEKPRLARFERFVDDDVDIALDERAEIRAAEERGLLRDPREVALSGHSNPISKSVRA